MAATELPKQTLEASAFNQAKTRIEKSQRIKNDLKPPTGNYNKERVEEVRGIERRSKQGQEGKRSGFEELVIDTRDFQERRFKMTYVSQNGQETSEDLVMFVKLGKGGQPEWLTTEGQPLTLNADLYDSRLNSQLHAQGTDFRSTVIPKVDGRGAYTGVVSIIETKGETKTRESDPLIAKAVPNVEQILQQVDFGALPSRAGLEAFAGITSGQLNFESIAQAFKLDQDKAPKPDSFIAPVMGNMFGEDDIPTLAGKVIARVYNQLILKPDYSPPHNRQEVEAIIEKCKEGQRGFMSYLEEKVKKERWEKGDTRITFGLNRPDGSDAFHFNGDSNPVKDHVFYFNKSHQNWKNPREPETRAYITLSSKEIDTVQRHFVDLTLLMYDAGIDFSGKCASPAGLLERTDNMVFYIAVSDQPRASAMIKNFLTERGIGKGHVVAATPSPQDGLSWAQEPDGKQTKIWQDISGSTEAASFNSYVAAMAMPIYLERLALANSKKGDKQSADIFMKEAQRVRNVIAQQQLNKT